MPAKEKSCSTGADDCKMVLNLTKSYLISVDMNPARKRPLWGPLESIESPTWLYFGWATLLSPAGSQFLLSVVF